MSTTLKLQKVLEHLIRNEEDAAKELLHNIFIEKARASHAELMLREEEELEDLEVIGGTGDLGRDLTDEIKVLDDEIEFEETMSEDTEELTVSDDVDSELESTDSTLDSEELVDDVDDKMSELDAALAKLTAEFEKLSADESNETEDSEIEDNTEIEDHDVDVDVSDEEEISEEEDFEFDDEFEELAEAVELEVIAKDPLTTDKEPREVGAGKTGSSVGKNAKSPVAASQTSRLGAEPVVMGRGPKNDSYKLQDAPKVVDAEVANNRRKKGEEPKAVKSPSNALLNKPNSDGYGKTGTTSPLTYGNKNLK